MVPGCHITAVSRHAHQALLAERLGASEVLHGDEPHDEIAAVTGARMFHGLFGSYNLLGGFEVVYDCVGSPASLKNCLRWTRAGGTVVLVGLNMTPMQLDLSPVWHQEVNLIGVMAHGVEPFRGGIWHTYNVVIDLLRQGVIQVSPLITHRLPLSNWRRAITVASDKQTTKAIKVVLDINNLA
jgi:threonine dehydrogenase-like Zn-dependent dehydrogenase